MEVEVNDNSAFSVIVEPDVNVVIPPYDGLANLLNPEPLDFDPYWASLQQNLLEKFGTGFEVHRPDVLQPLILCARDMEKFIAESLRSLPEPKITHLCMRFTFNLERAPFRLWKIHNFAETSLQLMPKDCPLRMIYQAVFLHLLRRHIPPKYATREDFLNVHHHIRFRDATEQSLQQQTAEWFNLALYTLTPKTNKGHFMNLVPRMVEGPLARYVTGSGETVATSDRVNLFRFECNTPKIERPKFRQFHRRKNKRVRIHREETPTAVPSMISKDTTVKRACVSFDALRMTSCPQPLTVLQIQSSYSTSKESAPLSVHPSGQMLRSAAKRSASDALRSTKQSTTTVSAQSAVTISRTIKAPARDAFHRRPPSLRTRSQFEYELHEQVMNPLHLVPPTFSCAGNVKSKTRKRAPRFSQKSSKSAVEFLQLEDADEKEWFAAVQVLSTMASTITPEESSGIKN